MWRVWFVRGMGQLGCDGAGGDGDGRGSLVGEGARDVVPH